MLEFVALLEARDQSAAEAHSALPGAPVRLDASTPVPVAAAVSGRLAALRLAAGRALRGLADRIEPTRLPAPANGPVCR